MYRPKFSFFKTEASIPIPGFGVSQALRELHNQGHIQSDSCLFDPAWQSKITDWLKYQRKSANQFDIAPIHEHMRQFQFTRDVNIDDEIPGNNTARVSDSLRFAYLCGMHLERDEDAELVFVQPDSFGTGTNASHFGVVLFSKWTINNIKRALEAYGNDADLVLYSGDGTFQVANTGYQLYMFGVLDRAHVFHLVAAAFMSHFTIEDYGRVCSHLPMLNVEVSYVFLNAAVV